MDLNKCVKQCSEACQVLTEALHELQRLPSGQQSLLLELFSDCLETVRKILVGLSHLASRAENLRAVKSEASNLGDMAGQIKSIISELKKKSGKSVELDLLDKKAKLLQLHASEIKKCLA